MGDYSSIMGTLYTFTEWFVKFTVTNIIWFILNIPIALIVLNIIMSDIGSLYYALPLILLVPLLFFPSTIALYATVRSWIINRNENVKLIRNYFKHFKGNYIKSFFSGIIWVAIWFVWIVDFNYFNRVNSYIAFFMIIVGFVLIVFNINFFSLSAHYHMKIKELFKNSFYITLGSPLLFISVLVIHLTLTVIGITRFWFLFPLIIGSGSAFLSFLAFYWLSLKAKEKHSHE